MTQIQWNSIGERRFEVGIDRGVLYIPSESVAVPWNGLTGVTDSADATVDPLYFNGIKYFDYVSRGDFKASLSAYTYPPEFEIFDGVLESPANGIFVTGQVPKGVFHLSYRTKIGNDLDGLDGGYKIHVLYNLTARPSGKAYSTLAQSLSAYEFSWELTSVPVSAFNYRPTSHIIFDTTKMHETAIYEVERTIYGTDTTPPKIVSVEEFEEMTSTAAQIEIIDHGDGTWSATGSDYYIKRNLGYGEFRIDQADALYLDAHTYELSSTD